MPMAIFVGLVAAAVGAGVGMFLQEAVGRADAPEPADRRVVAVALLPVVTIPAARNVAGVLAFESWNRPRVIATTGVIVRRAVDAEAQPDAVGGTTLWECGAVATADAAPFVALTWNGAPVSVQLDGAGLSVRAARVQTTPIALEGFDYVSEVIGATATPEGAEAEWLAILLRLRPSSHRVMLVIFDPSGELAYQELIERHKWKPDESVLFTTGGRSGPRNWIVDLDTPTAYTAQR